MLDNFEFKDSYNINDLIKIMQILRGENGCPWDREQNHHSIRNNFLEEVYEVVDAIDREDSTDLKEELGDVLLQVVFHSQIKSEELDFNFNDVSNGICQKLILRHPHIFSTTKVKDTKEVLNNWDKIKMSEKGQANFTQTLKSVPSSFPALTRAAKVQKRAAKANFDWDSVEEPIQKVKEELNELVQEIKENNKEATFQEFGDLLFAAVNVSRFINVDPEQALQYATNKFIKRFEKVENLAQDNNIKMENASLEDLDKLWDKAKLSDNLTD